MDTICCTCRVCLAGGRPSPNCTVRARHCWRFSRRLCHAAERAHTTIVFDAAGAPPGLPQRFLHEGIGVEFARDPGNADELLEKLIAADDAPRKLMVVSGDHRVQRAARRRRAQAIDSDRWWAELCAQRHRQGAKRPPFPQKPSGPPSASEVEYWTGQFGDSLEEGRGQGQTPAPRNELENPFPPGYGEELLDDKAGD